MRVAMGMPIVDSVAGEVFTSHVIAACAISRKHEFAMIPCLNTFPHDKAREQIIEKALEGNVDMLFWVDSDMAVPRDAFELLHEALVSTGAQMAVGHAHRRGYPYTPCWFTIQDGKTYQATAGPEASPCEIASGGMACNVLDLNWVRQYMAPPYFYQGHLPDRGYVWEDWFFCNGIQEAGGKIIGVPQVRCGHLGERILVEDHNASVLRKNHLQIVSGNVQSGHIKERDSNGWCKPQLQD